MGDLKIDSLQYILRKIDLSADDLFKSGRYGGRKTARKRWVVFYFYHLMGKSYPWIAKITKHNHTTVMHAVAHIDIDSRSVAEEYFQQYVTDVLHEDLPVFNKKPVKMVFKRVPDYKNNKTVLVLVEEDSVKPVKKVRKWDL